jgi:hypothetical protein
LQLPPDPKRNEQSLIRNVERSPVGLVPRKIDHIVAWRPPSGLVSGEQAAKVTHATTIGESKLGAFTGLEWQVAPIAIGGTSVTTALMEHVHSG